MQLHEIRCRTEWKFFKSPGDLGQAEEQVAELLSFIKPWNFKRNHGIA